MLLSPLSKEGESTLIDSTDDGALTSIHFMKACKLSRLGWRLDGYDVAELSGSPSSPFPVCILAEHQRPSLAPKLVPQPREWPATESIRQVFNSSLTGVEADLFQRPGDRQSKGEQRAAWPRLLTPKALGEGGDEPRGEGGAGESCARWTVRERVTD